MALSTKRDDIKQVPWFSLAEWHDVYRQIYSNDTAQQVKAYEALLAWKARMPKLPVGVDCTLWILQACLRDREWTSKIDSGELPMYYENDLSLMYSTTIMRFLNHISHIGATKLESLFKIAQQLKIPSWIVNLRHEAAHGHELPSIGLLRIAMNILLRWLHDEYWAVEARAMEECYIKEINMLEEKEELQENQVFTELIELWAAVNLYIDTGYELVSDLPEVHIRETLQNLRTYALSYYNSEPIKDDETGSIIVNKKVIKLDKEYDLKTAQFLLLCEICEHFTEDKSSIEVYKKSDTICNVLCKNEVFLPNSDVLQIFQHKEEKNIDLNRKILPPSMFTFWKDIILLLHKNDMLKILMFKLLNIVHEERESKKRRTFAALWISSIIYSFIQLDIVQNISHTVEYESEKSGRKLSAKDLSQQLKEQVHSSYPYLQDVLWLDLSSNIPDFLVDINLLSKLLLRVNEFSARLIEPILKLVAPRIDVQTTEHLSNLLNIYVFQKYTSGDKDSSNDDKVFTVDDLYANPIGSEVKIRTKKCTIKKDTACLLADQVIRNVHWKPALDTRQWGECPIGLLPWQMDSLKTLQPLEIRPSKHPVSDLDSQIVAGIVNHKNLKMQSCIRWNQILRNQGKMERRIGRKQKIIADAIMKRALKISKKKKYKYTL
ncbi:ribosomal biogenesis protein LAS1L isoform X2 [Linepithema humile]|nr:PREDICTED: ribosomal biogenesis protein LAS1L isoform X2 [Linepithema humile]